MAEETLPNSIEAMKARIAAITASNTINEKAEEQVKNEEMMKDTIPALTSAPVEVKNELAPTDKIPEWVKVHNMTGDTDTPKQKILKQYGGLRSNIPVNSPYWGMK